ncbi:hypothetical protein ANN_26660 [Periplaneta americana]|uniref:DUF7869 domain-containing protein n=1 Tax=Periplaneta americana TaxID=6978 RepID=A0ABQ8RZD5_PERAM|nr:hypothetical protein ANN_26660 [Periplaneta americana]
MKCGIPLFSFKMVPYGERKECHNPSRDNKELEARIRGIITNAPRNFLQKTVDSITGHLRKLVEATDILRHHTCVDFGPAFIDIYDIVQRAATRGNPRQEESESDITSSDDVQPSTSRHDVYIPDEEREEKPHLISRWNSLIGIHDLYLTKQLTELLGSRLQEWKVLDKDANVSVFRNINKDLLPFFIVTDSGVCTCSDVNGLIKKTDSSAVAAVKSLSSEQILEDILFIDSNFEIVSKSIILLESSKLQLSEVLNIVDKVSQTVIQNNNSLISEKVKWCSLLQPVDPPIDYLYSRSALEPIAELFSCQFLELLDEGAALRSCVTSLSIMSSTEEDEFSLGGKRKANPQSYKRNVVKQARLKGEAYTNYSGKKIDAKTVGENCRMQCTQNIGDDDYVEIFKQIYTLKTKNEQDIFLQGLIDVQDIARNRLRQGEKKLDRTSFKYHVLLGTQPIQLKLKIKSPHINDAAKCCAIADLAVHNRKSKKFHAALREEFLDELKGLNNNVLSLSFDYMMNVSLPKVLVQDLFYLRQLTVNLFCVHDIKKNKAVFYLYHEEQAKKGPDEVYSYLLDYLQHYLPAHIEVVRLFSDNCVGQNKNHPLSRLLVALTDTKQLKIIQHFFPTRGHSYLPCDRDFNIVKRRLEKTDRIYTVHQLTELIIESSTTQKFTVREVDSYTILNFKDWWTKFYKRIAISLESSLNRRDERVHFGITSLHHFIYDSDTPGYIVAMAFINGLVKHTFNVGLQQHVELA